VIVPEPFYDELRLRWVALGGDRFYAAAMLGGGTLINQIWIDEVRSLLRQGLRVCAFGTGVGSCGFAQPHQVPIQDWKPLLADFARIGVRGPLSRAALEDIGIAGAEVIGDTALCWTRDEAGQKASEPRFAINTCVPPSENCGVGEFAALSEIEHGARELVRAGWTPIPLAMHHTDLPSLELLMDRIGVSTPVRLVSSAEEMLDLVAPCEFCVAVRLHAAILSCCAGVPLLMIGYRQKCLDFMQSMELDDWHVPLTGSPKGEMLDRLRMMALHARKLQPVVLDRALRWKKKLAAAARTWYPEADLGA
jgi:polysaccharide pyruvyl transferase WcaK-like protein